VVIVEQHRDEGHGKDARTGNPDDGRCRPVVADGMAEMFPRHQRQWKNPTATRLDTGLLSRPLQRLLDVAAPVKGAEVIA
jgi:hypothetical protein